MPLADLLKEGERIMIICNACRYCEGHCAVFPAMEQRTEFPPRDLAYLANLCHDSGPGVKPSARHLGRATLDILQLRYLDGGAGDGCTYPREAPSQARRVFHHFTYYGFLLCLASTTVAAIYDNYLARKAPYPVASVPVLLGIAGGIGLLVGPAGLLALKFQSDPGPNPRSRLVMDVTFLVL